MFLPNIRSYVAAFVTNRSTRILKESSKDRGTYFIIPVTGLSSPFPNPMVRLLFSTILVNLLFLKKFSDTTDTLALVSNIPFISIPNKR